MGWASQNSLAKHEDIFSILFRMKIEM